MFTIKYQYFLDFQLQCPTNSEVPLFHYHKHHTHGHNLHVNNPNLPWIHTKPNQVKGHEIFFCLSNSQKWHLTFLVKSKWSKVVENSIDKCSSGLLVLSLCMHLMHGCNHQAPNLCVGVRCVHDRRSQTFQN